MKKWQLHRLGLLLACVISVPGCRTAPSKTQTTAAMPPSELCQTSYLFEVVRHLYRWYLDETEIERVMGAKRFVFWVRSRTQTRSGRSEPLG